jgi:nitrogen fixation-related uncharacterized protein
MRKYTSLILVAVFLLSIVVGVFWDWIIQVDAITIGVAIIAALLGLFCFLYSVGRMLLYGERIDWSKPNIFIRPFLPPIDSEQPHRFTD